jgi:hypothetical protein
MPLQATSGAASYDAFGGGVPVVPNYIEDVFSTYLYTGTGSTLAISNGVDLSSKGGLVWLKRRNATSSNQLYDTARGAAKLIYSDLTDSQISTTVEGLQSFNSNGFTLGGNWGGENFSGGTMASWTFRKQPKFFDIVTYTGNSVAGRTVAHNLGSVPGSIFVKVTSAANDWLVYHRNDGTTAKVGLLNSNQAAFNNSGIWFGDGTSAVPPTSTQFTVSNSTRLNSAGETYVAYLFAHDAGGFGLTGTDNVISCGSFTTDGSSNYSVTLGYEPQWVLWKRTNTTGNWQVYDNMRGMGVAGTSFVLYPDLSNAEAGPNSNTAINSTGFSGTVGSASQTYIYIAIRRGPMKVPTSGTSVFTPATRTGTATTTTITGVGFPPDAVLSNTRDYTTYTGYVGQFWDRLRGAGSILRTPSANSEGTVADAGVLGQSGYTVSNSGGGQNDINDPFIDYSFRRAPSFFDEVCYTGTGVARTVAHNLGVAPEMLIVKYRSTTGPWYVYVPSLGNTYLSLHTTNAINSAPSSLWNSTAPTSSVFSLGTLSTVNEDTGTYVAYLFGSCAGVSKVGSYTGTATTKQIDCGFTGGARFVLIKRTDSTGGWHFWDTARGIVSGDDPYLLFNSTAAEVTNTDYIDTYSAGFEISSTAPDAINASGGTFIFLAIA